MANRNHDPKKTHEIALSGLLFALAMALSFIEGTLVIPGLAPGMKLGLANIVVMYALFFMGARQALYLDLLKALFVFLVSGWTAGFLSLCGGLLSLLVMWMLYYKLPFRPTWFILSVCGALSHNIGQLLGAGLILSSAMSLYYAPVMLVLGLVNFFTTIPIRPAEMGRMTMAIKVIRGLMLSIMIRTPIMVVMEVISCVMLWFRLCPSVSTSLVIRERTSPTVLLSKYFMGIRLIFSQISCRKR